MIHRPEPNELANVFAQALPLEQRSAAPELAALIVSALSGEQSSAEIQHHFAAQPHLTAALATIAQNPAACKTPTLSLALQPDTGQVTIHDRGSNVHVGLYADVVQSVIVSGGNVGKVVGKELHTQVTVNLAGAVLNATPLVLPQRLDRSPQPPRRLRNFLDRSEALALVRDELAPGGGIWAYGSPGCGLSAFVHQAAATLPAAALPDGVVHMRGEHEPPFLDDVAQRLFQCFYTAPVTFKVDAPTARTYLSNIRAFFAFDHLLLDRADQIALTDSLAQSAVLVAADGPAPETLADLPLRGLPPSDAYTFGAQAIGIDPAHLLSNMPLFDQLSAALDDLPLPLLLAGRMIRRLAVNGAHIREVGNHPLSASAQAPPAETALIKQAIAAFASIGGDHPLERVLRWIITGLSANEVAVLKALLGAGGPHADLDTLAAISKHPKEQVTRTLAQLQDVRLIEVADGRYAWASASVRRILDLLLAPTNERQRAAIFFATAVNAHQGDLEWLALERGNLTTAIETALAEGWTELVGTLAQALQPELVLDGLWESWGSVIDQARRAAELGNDPHLLAWALHEQGTRAGLLGDQTAAASNLSEALNLRLRHDPTAAAVTRHNMEYLGLWPPPPPPDNTAPDAAGPLLRRIPLWLKLALVILLPLTGISSAGAVWWYNRLPTASFSATPNAGSYPLEVRFDAGASRSGQNGHALIYVWDFGDDSAPVETRDPQISHTYAAPGSYTASLWVEDERGKRLENPFTSEIEVRNEPPQPQITLFANTTAFVADETITLSGQAIDTEDGALDDTQLRWTVRLNTSDTIQTILADEVGKDIAVTIPPSADVTAATQLEIQLTASDSLGATAVVTKTLQPALVTLTLRSEPAGLQLRINDQTVTTPYTWESWAGAVMPLVAPAQLDTADMCQVFAAWSDGDTAAARTITSTSSIEYTATFRPLAVTLAAATLAAAESSDAAGMTVALNAEADCPITVKYTTSDGTAIAGQDYAPESGELRFAAGVTAQRIEIPITNDQLDELAETVELRLSEASGAVVGAPATAVITIQDDDPAPTITFEQAALSIDENASVAEIRVRLSAPSGQTISLPYAATDGTANSEADYRATNGTLTFAPGTIIQTFTVQIKDDDRDEADETVALSLGEPVNAELDIARATLTIRDNDLPPVVGFAANRFSVAEDAGSASIEVVLSQASGLPVSVTYATSDQSATGGDDYTSVTGRLTFAPGETSQTFTVPISIDQFDEAEETVALTLSNPENATAGVFEATLVIANDDPLPAIQFAQDGYTVNESASAVVVTVTLNLASGEEVAINYSIANGTANAGADYSAASGTLAFGWGQWTQTISIPITNDRSDEPDETFTLALSDPRNAVLGPLARTTVTIRDDDEPVVSFAETSYSVSEEGGLPIFQSINQPSRVWDVTVKLDPPSWQEVRVNYSTADGTASASSDYAATSGVLTFKPGETTKTVTVTVTDDRIYEGDEWFALRLSDPVNAKLGQSEAVITIVDNDPPDNRGPEIGAPQITPLTRNGALEIGCSTEVTFRVSISDPAGVGTVTLGYKHPTYKGLQQRRIDMQLTNGAYTAVFELRSLIPDSLLEYTIAATDALGNQTTRFGSISVDASCSDLQ
jgi:PKD repeat protein